MITLSKKANEKSTYVVKVSFLNELGELVTPNSITWSLSDKFGNIINSREDIVVTIPDTTIYIVLSGNDLATTTINEEERVVTVKALYDSTLGTDLPLIESAEFNIKNLPLIT